MAGERRRFGYMRLHVLLKQEDHAVNSKRIQRLYREEKLTVRRQGVSRDGHHLYPAHPYTSFAKAPEADIQALYAYLMTRDADAARPPRTELGFPFNIRPLMAAWNALFLRSAPQVDAARSPEWNRGAELVEGLGHCSACHSPRNALGAERGGAAHLSGGIADGWHAPALTSLSVAPVAWTEQTLFDYLRSGRSFEHGSAAGPMAHVVESLEPLPDSDIRAMAIYLASFTGEGSRTAENVVAAAETAAAFSAVAEPLGARIFEGACASCHGGDPSIPSLALNTNLHAATSVNVRNAIREGIPAHRDAITSMPAFDGVLDAESTNALIRYMRAHFAPSAPSW